MSQSGHTWVCLKNVSRRWNFLPTVHGRIFSAGLGGDYFRLNPLLMLICLQRGNTSATPLQQVLLLFSLWPLEAWCGRLALFLELAAMAVCVCVSPSGCGVFLMKGCKTWLASFQRSPCTKSHWVKICPWQFRTVFWVVVNCWVPSGESRAGGSNLGHFWRPVYFKAQNSPDSCARLSGKFWELEVHRSWSREIQLLGASRPNEKWIFTRPNHCPLG